MVQKKSSPRILRKRAARREQIEQAALEIIVSDGLEGLTMQKLATQLDYAVGALYRYYSSKDKLLAALQAQVIALFTEVFQTADHWAQSQESQDVSSHHLARLYLAAQLYLEMRQLSPTRFYLLNEMIASPQEVLSLQEGLQVMKVVMPLLQHIAQIFDDAATHGALQEGGDQRRAILFWAALQGVLPLAKLTRFVPGYRFDALFTELQDSLCQGWGASPALCRTAGERAQAWMQAGALQEILEVLQEGDAP